MAALALAPHLPHPVTELQQPRVCKIERLTKVCDKSPGLAVAKARQPFTNRLPSGDNRKGDRLRPLSGRERYCRSVGSAGAQQRHG